MRTALLIGLLIGALITQGCGFAFEPFLRLDELTLRATDLDRSAFTFQTTETESADGWLRQIVNASAREQRPQGVSDVSLIKVSSVAGALDDRALDDRALDDRALDVNTALGSVNGRDPHIGSICGVDSQLRFRPGSGFFVWGAQRDPATTRNGELQLVGLAVLIYGLDDNDGATAFSELLLEVEVDGEPVLDCEPAEAQADVLAVLQI